MAAFPYVFLVGAIIGEDTVLNKGRLSAQQERFRLFGQGSGGPAVPAGGDKFRFPC